MGNIDSPFVKTSPLPDLARKQTEHLASLLAQLQSDSDAFKARERRSTVIQFLTLAIATATLIAAIVPLIH